MAPNVGLFSLLIASIFTSNILLSNFLGMCSFIAVSKDLKSSNGLGLAVTFVLVITGVLDWLALNYILIPFHITYLKYIVYIIVIAASVQLLEMIIDRYSPTLYMSLGIFLPLITVNCAILGATLFLDTRQYNLMQSFIFSLGAGLGWWLAIATLAAIRKKVDKAPVPNGLKGPGITFLIIGVMAMAFTGFSGMLSVQ